MMNIRNENFIYLFMLYIIILFMSRQKNNSLSPRLKNLRTILRLILIINPNTNSTNYGSISTEIFKK